MVDGSDAKAFVIPSESRDPANLPQRFRHEIPRLSLGMTAVVNHEITAAGSACSSRRDLSHLSPRPNRSHHRKTLRHTIGSPGAARNGLHERTGGHTSRARYLEARR